MNPIDIPSTIASTILLFAIVAIFCYSLVNFSHSEKMAKRRHKKWQVDISTGNFEYHLKDDYIAIVSDHAIVEIERSDIYHWARENGLLEWVDDHFDPATSQHRQVAGFVTYSEFWMLTLDNFIKRYLLDKSVTIKKITYV